MNKRLILILLALTVVATTIFLHSRLLGRIPDTDAFYHIRHSWLYRTTGLLENSFPWVQYSVINQYSADIWYGFHLLLTPFTYPENLISGIKTGSYFVTITSLLLVGAALWKLKIRWPILWLLIFAFASADLLYRLAMLRPHPISLGITLLLFAFLQKNSDEERFAGRKTLLAIYLLAAAFSWIHLSLSWLPILVLLTVLLLEIIQKQGIDWRKAVVMFLGIITGAFLRPNPIGALKIAYVQVVQLLLEKQSDLPLRFGKELKPFVLENFVDQLIPIVAFVLIGLAIAFSKRKSFSPVVKTAIWSSLILTIIFFTLAFGVARRSNEVFIGFSVILLGLVFTRALPLLNKKSSNYIILSIVSVVALIYMPIKTLYRFDTYIANAFNSNEFKELSEWLKNNSQPKEIVFNIHWDRFPQLFFWNHQNYYINGMDPIFQYAYNPSLYWKTHFLAIDAATAFTCGKIRCIPEETENTVEVLEEDFKASYVIVEKWRNPKLYKYVNSENAFKKVFENERESLFKIL